MVSAEAGDVIEPNFGLSTAVLQSADVILHSAASTSFKPGAGVYPINIKAAEQFSGILKNLAPSQRGFFVGTAAVTTEPRGVITEDMPFAGYANDYIRSKRDAETLLRAAGSPFVSLRPGIVLSRGIDDAKLSRNMKAEKSLSSLLSRRNISVAGNADHSVMAFILMVWACSSLSMEASNLSHGMSRSMFQRTASSCLNSSG